MRIRLLLAALIAVLSTSAYAFCFGDMTVHVFNDVNGNGVLDPGEPAMPGVSVQEDQAADGTIESTIVTNASGDATFHVPGVVPYRLRIVVPPGMSQTTANPADFIPPCLTTTTVNLGVVTAAPAISARELALLALVLIAIAMMRRA
jgi:hypothetical protein